MRSKGSDELQLFSNTSAEEDHVINALTEYAAGEQVRIASAFFSDWKTLKRIAETAKTVELIVRLNDGTSSVALDEIIDLENVKVFFYTAQSFHPKLYIFGNRAALVGSSNITHSGLHTNAEMNVLIPGSSKIFPKLAQKFEGYKAGASNLTRVTLREYQEIEKRFKKPAGDSMDSELQRQSWAKAPLNANTEGRSHREWDKHQAFIAKYESFLGNFRILKAECEKDPRMMKLAKVVPLRIVIDQFLNWVKMNKIAGRSYLKQPLRDIPGLQRAIAAALREFTENPPSMEHAEENYRKLNAAFGSAAGLAGLGEKKLVEAAGHIYAFSTYIGRYRSEDGVEGFLELNGVDAVRKTFSYLLHGADDYKTRIAKASSDPDYRLYWFGESSVTELYGWVNTDDTPILNGRVKKAMRYLGFDIEIFHDEDWE